MDFSRCILPLTVGCVALQVGLTCAASPGGLCVIGCVPYVDPMNPLNGIEKYRALTREMAKTCDLIVHVGDIKSGSMPCNEHSLTFALEMLVEEANATGVPVLYTPGDNEISDCHRFASTDGPTPPGTNFYRAFDARNYLLDHFDIGAPFDLTGNVDVFTHDRAYESNPATCVNGEEQCTPYTCSFNKYIAMEEYSVATLEVPGNHWYLDDERNEGFPYQNEIDPFTDRLVMYVNAKDCALEWIEFSAQRAHAAKKKVLFLLFHSHFYARARTLPLFSNTIGDYFSPANLYSNTSQWGDAVSRPLQPLFDKLHETALLYPDMIFQMVHSEGHRSATYRLFPSVNNLGYEAITSPHNMMVHQTEGSSRALTMFSRFTVDSSNFQPITLKEEWSRAAYLEEPEGHTWAPY